VPGPQDQVVLRRQRRDWQLVSGLTILAYSRRRSFSSVCAQHDPISRRVERERSAMHGPNWFARLGLVVALAICLSPATARAVVISAASDAANRIAPGNDPGWNNVGRLSGASAVYLGNRWVITANHIAQTAFHLTDGRSFDMAVGSAVTLKPPGNPFTSQGADLRMFRLAEDPGLPSLTIADATPARSEIVTMIGAGLDQAPGYIGWSVNARGQWTQTILPFANQTGFALLDTQHMRWGVNRVTSSASSILQGDNTFVFATQFDRQGMPFEAQAVLGDSGGGVFQSIDDSWELAGLMISQQPLSGQPTRTAVYGNSTFTADLSKYRDQILKLVDHAEPLWQNQANHFDVDGSGRVNAHDLLVLMNELKRGNYAVQDLGGSPGPGDFRFDVDGDLRLTAQDGTSLLNALLGNTANPTSSQSATGLVPEPSSAVLAAVGVLVLAWIGMRRRFARR
jgi:uncharacterized protein (TIGR03382 family)